MLRLKRHCLVLRRYSHRLNRFFFSFFFTHSDKASSSSPDQRELYELPTSSQQTLVDDPKPERFYRIDPSSRCQQTEEQCSVTPSTSSAGSANTYGKNSRKTSHVQLHVNPQWQKPTLHPDQHSEESKLEKSLPGKAPVSSCGRSHMRSKVSWV